MKKQGIFSGSSRAKFIFTGMATAALIASIGTMGCSSSGSSDSSEVTTLSSTTESVTENESSSTSEAQLSEADMSKQAQAATSGFSLNQSDISNVTLLNEYEHSVKDEANATNNAPKTFIDKFGFTVQPTPDDGGGWNNSYLNADNRGCTSCHTIEDAVMNLDTYHRLIFMGYPTTQTVANCAPCHSGHQPLRETIHSIHMNSPEFVGMTGNCESCHVINEDGSYGLWDDEKYNVLTGMKDIPIDDADINVSYDQDTVTPLDQQFCKTIKSEPSTWLLDDDAIDESIYENWTIKIDGDVENPFEMTLPEFEEKFGTTSDLYKVNCTVNGVGQATIYQTKGEGVPVDKILEYAQVKDGANCVHNIGDDGTDYLFPVDFMMNKDVILATKSNDKTLRNSQGYPVSVFMKTASGADFLKRVAEFKVTTEPDGYKNSIWEGNYLNSHTGEMYAKPDSAVLNYPTGVVLTGEDADPVHLEGFADAWDEPITKIEYSLDHGTTWKVIDLKDADADKWVYWRLDFTPPETGSYLLSIRTTSKEADGTLRVSNSPTQFMFNVK